MTAPSGPPARDQEDSTPPERIDLVKGDDGSTSQTELVQLPTTGDAAAVATPVVDDFLPADPPIPDYQPYPPGGPVAPAAFGAAPQNYAQPLPSYPQPPQHSQPQQNYGQPQQNYGPQFVTPPPAYGPGYGAAPYNPYGAQYPMLPPTKHTDAKAVISLILGVLSVPLAFLCGVFGIIGAVAGIILGGVAINEAGKTGNKTNRGMAIGGLVLSILDILLAIAVFAVIIATGR
ncbi:DUF4190 domain-containing protein [Gordonia sp. TBRC 11910]|uniref:DUF4190 domain-containing protein n=1 Tax=Gordonia asplenii TaxID=2725283 RepID=A0A848KQD1_9ACTN|nr:DUF4190 domain-containing protein [Gordonia asplenii]NMO00540.1 DUF4190 domain-containing protein [Gordonia asplenii]